MTAQASLSNRPLCTTEASLEPQSSRGQCTKHGYSSSGKRLPLQQARRRVPSKTLGSRVFESQEDEQWYELNSTLFKIKCHSYIARIPTVHLSRSQVAHFPSVMHWGVSKEQLPINSNRTPRFALIHINL